MLCYADNLSAKKTIRVPASWRAYYRFSGFMRARRALRRRAGESLSSSIYLYLSIFIYLYLSIYVSPLPPIKHTDE